VQPRRGACQTQRGILGEWGHAPARAACNHAKGRHHDARGPQDARAREVVAALLSARLARWRAPPPAPVP